MNHQTCGTCRYWQRLADQNPRSAFGQGRCRVLTKQPFWAPPIYPVTLSAEGGFCAEWREQRVSART